MPTLLFLCSGNYYRSRFAEIYFNRLAEPGGSTWRAISRGLELHAGNIGPISAYALEYLARLGIEDASTDRLPATVLESELLAADVIVALKETEHRPKLARDFPAWTDRVEYWHIHDIDCARPEDALSKLQRQVEMLYVRLVEGTSVNASYTSIGKTSR